MKFEKISATANRPKRNELSSGTVFHYINNQVIYLKIDGGHVDLHTGQTFTNTIMDERVIIIDATLHYKDKE